MFREGSRVMTRDQCIAAARAIVRNAIDTQLPVGARTVVIVAVVTGADGEWLGVDAKPYGVAANAVVPDVQAILRCALHGADIKYHDDAIDMIDAVDEPALLASGDEDAESAG